MVQNITKKENSTKKGILLDKAITKYFFLIVYTGILFFDMTCEDLIVKALLRATCR